MRKIIILVSFSLCFAYNSLNITANWTINFYKKIISPLQGQQICNFSPTCSQFYKQSINKYGIVIGSLMGSDRLLRCNSCAWTYMDKYYDGIDNERIADPPENHYIKITNNQYPLSDLNKELPTETDKYLKTDLDFADYLYANQDYARAIGEYKRLYFNTPDFLINQKEYCNLMLGECYLKINQYDQALNYFSFGDNIYYQYGKARVFLQADQIDKARASLIVLDDSSLNKEKIILIGVSYFKQGDYKSGTSYLSEYLYLNDYRIERLSEFDGRKIVKRNRTIATLLSAIIPGTGQIYSDRFGDGLFSFVTVTSCGLISSYYWKNDATKIKFSIFSLLTAFFWAGNLYGANIAARDFNQHQVNKYQQSINNILENINFIPDYKKIYRK